MIGSFEEASAIEPVGDRTFRWIVPDGWQQGRGAFGGLVVGAMVRALQRDEHDATRALRSITADLCAPAVVGDATITSTTLRRGRAMTFLDARISQGGSEAVAHASAIFASARSTPSIALPSDAPRLRPWREMDAANLGSSPAPVFTQHYEYRSTAGAPFAGKTTREALCEGWIRERHPPRALDAAAIAGRIDAWWPTLFALDPTPRPVATIAFTMQLLADPSSLPPDQPLAYRARMLSLGEGLFVELRELWHEGRCLALNPQTFAILG